MPKVTLSRAWNPGAERYAAGDEVEVSEETAAWLEASGATSVDKPKRVKVAPPVEESPRPETAEVSASEKTVHRPARAASTEEWRKFAATKGISTKGLSKQEIIAATRD